MLNQFRLCLVGRGGERKGKLNPCLYAREGGKETTILIGIREGKEGRETAGNPPSYRHQEEKEERDRGIASLALLKRLRKRREREKRATLTEFQRSGPREGREKKEERKEKAGLLRRPRAWSLPFGGRGGEHAVHAVRWLPRENRRGKGGGDLTLAIRGATAREAPASFSIMLSLKNAGGGKKKGKNLELYPAVSNTPGKKKELNLLLCCSRSRKKKEGKRGEKERKTSASYFLHGENLEKGKRSDFSPCKRPKQKGEGEEREERLRDLSKPQPSAGTLAAERGKKKDVTSRTFSNGSERKKKGGKGGKWASPKAASARAHRERVETRSPSELYPCYLVTSNGGRRGKKKGRLHSSRKGKEKKRRKERTKM